MAGGPPDNHDTSGGMVSSTVAARWQDLLNSFPSLVSGKSLERRGVVGCQNASRAIHIARYRIYIFVYLLFDLFIRKGKKRILDILTCDVPIVFHKKLVNQQ